MTAGATRNDIGIPIEYQAKRDRQLNARAIILTPIAEVMKEAVNNPSA
jgi:hypothetical protein